MEFKLAGSGGEEKPNKKEAVAPTADSWVKSPQLSDIISDRYRVQSRAGIGGMGVVEIVEDTQLDRVLALKVMSEEHAQDKSSRDNFVGEAVITAQLQHPNIIPVHDMGELEQGDVPYYTMKLVDGEELDDILKRLQVGDPEYIEHYTRFRLIDIFRKVCDAVSYAHSKGIIHRDLKPSNIMIGEFGEVLLLDWGLAKHCGVKDGFSSEDADKLSAEEKLNQDEKFDENQFAEMTMDGMIKGSLAYLSPEQALGHIDEVDHQTDIFLLGATLYHILTYSPPYVEKSALDTVLKAERTDFPHPRTFASCRDVPNTLIDIVMKAMDPQKPARFKTVEEMIYAIDRYLSGENVSHYRTVNPGEVLIKDGATDRETYILVSGTVDVIVNMNGQPTVMNTLEPGAVFGELSGINHEVRTATVVANEECEVLHISYDLLSDELRKLPPWMEHIVISLAQRVSTMNRRVHPYVIQNCSFPVLKQIFYIFSSVSATSRGDKSVDYQGLCHEISNNLALPFSRIESVLAVLEDYDLCSRQNGRFRLSSLTKISELLTCIRRESHIQKGLGISMVKLDTEALHAYQEIHDALMKCD